MCIPLSAGAGAAGIFSHGNDSKITWKINAPEVTMGFNTCENQIFILQP
jgi:hypothetical protein